MEGVVDQVRVGAPCKRFAIKGNSICDRSARGFDGGSAKPHSFFSPENNAGGDTREQLRKERSF
jgi:hypothetical protein